MRIISLISLLLLLSAPLAALGADDMVGEVSTYTTRKKGEDISDIARKFDVGWVELVAANPGVRTGKMAKGTLLVIPGAHLLPPVREGVVVNLSGMRLYYFAEDGSVFTHPISIGKEGWATPVGEAEIVDKRKNPAWRPPASIRKEDPSLPEIVPPGPDNPLGNYALALNLDGVMIHGTTSPRSIGKRKSHGCMRMYPEDIETLFGQVSIGTPVTILDTPYKLGFRGQSLYLEVSPTQEQAIALQAGRPKPETDAAPIHAAVQALSVSKNVLIDWYTVSKTVQNADGIPTNIGFAAER